MCSTIPFKPKLPSTGLARTATCIIHLPSVCGRHPLFEQCRALRDSQTEFWRHTPFRSRSLNRHRRAQNRDWLMRRAPETHEQAPPGTRRSWLSRQDASAIGWTPAAYLAPRLATETSNDFSSPPRVTTSVTLSPGLFPFKRLLTMTHD